LLQLLFRQFEEAKALGSFPHVVEWVQDEVRECGTQALHKQHISNTSVYNTGTPPQAERVLIMARMGAAGLEGMKNR